jgi:hypothetical protein
VAAVELDGVGDPHHVRLDAIDDCTGETPGVE